MSAEPIFPRADKAAREVDPMILAQALDHIAKSAAKSRSSTRRLRWIERRAVTALEGREYRDIDLDLPKDAGQTEEKRSRRIGYLLAALHRIKELGPSNDVLQIIDEALAPALGMPVPAGAAPDGVIAGTTEWTKEGIPLPAPPAEAQES